MGRPGQQEGRMSNVVSLVDKTAEWMQDLDDQEEELKNVIQNYIMSYLHVLMKLLNAMMTFLINGLAIQRDFILTRGLS